MESGRHTIGISLVEILVALAVVAILAAIVVGVGSGLERQSKRKAVMATFAVLESALQEYYDFYGAYPEASDGEPGANCEKLYAELYSLPGSREVLERVEKRFIANRFDPGAVPEVQEIYDPWGTVLDYRYSPGDSFPRLISAGPDKDIKTAGDNITNR